MTINVSSSDLLFKTEKDIDAVMRKLHKISANGNPDFVIRNYAQFLNARQESSRVMSILLSNSCRNFTYSRWNWYNEYYVSNGY